MESARNTLTNLLNVPSPQTTTSGDDPKVVESQEPQHEQQHEQQGAPTTVNTSEESSDPTSVDASTSLDLCFVCDCTGSMGSYIEQAQENIINICESIIKAQKLDDMRFSLVCYRDHPPQDKTYVTKVFDFSSSYEEMKANVDTMKARGGGDAPEAVTAALNSALRLDYRDEATKIVIIIADAPPHGLGTKGDGFPNGCPDGNDPLEIVEEMGRQGITLYSVVCEPAMSNYPEGLDFYTSIAEKTFGKCIPLNSAKLLSKVIVGGAMEEISLENIMKEVERESKRVQDERKKRKLKEHSLEDLSRVVSSNLQAKGYKTNKMDVEDVYESRDRSNIVLMNKASKLSDIRGKLKQVHLRKKSKFSRPGSTQACSMSYGLVNPEHIKRVIGKSKIRK